ncbi:phage tail tape measure protein [Trinickia sp. LjRoot230]|uniref:phage tail tape measure protein n=1 Tax=Trinickia sp. LjRoot230 TaxID=3342288 RepID=UPI003ECF5162
MTMASGNDLKLRVLFDMIDGATKPMRAIMNGNRGLASALKATRGELGKLQVSQKDVTAFRTLQDGLGNISASAAAARDRVKHLSRSLRASGPPSQQMIAALGTARRELRQLTAGQKKQTAGLEQMTQRLTAAGVDLSNLSTHEAELKTKIAATTAVMGAQQDKLIALTARTKRLAEAREKLNKRRELAGNMASAGTKMMAGGAVVGAATFVPVAAYARAEDSATQLASALMRAGGTVPPAFEKINALAMKLGDRLPGATADFQDMMTMLTRQGISAQAILGGMGEATAYLGVQLRKTPAEAAEFTAKLQDATRTTERDMLSLTDVIQKAFMLGVDDNNMLQGFAKLGPAMDTIKQKGLEGAKALAPLLVMADQSGMDGSAAGNAYRKVFQLGMDAKKVAKANKQLAPAQRLDFTNGNGEFGGLDKMFAQFEKLKGLDTQKRLGVTKGVFGDDAETLQVISLMIEKGKSGYDEVQAKMAAQASMQERVNKQLGTLKNLWEAASGTFTNGLVAFGEAVAPEIKSVVDWLGDMAQRMGAWARENPRLANGLMKVAALAAVVMAALGGLTVVLAGVLGPFAVVRYSMAMLGLQGGILLRVLGLGAAAWRAFSAAAMFAGRAMLMNPIGLAVTAIAAAASLIYRYWEPIKAFFGGLWAQIQQAFAGGLSGIGALILDWYPIGLFYQAFSAVLQWFGIEMPAKFSELGANLIGGLVNGITSSLGAVRAAIANVADSTIGWFKEKLGIHSPSRVFGELGGFITQGAAIGMESEQGRIAKAAVSLATLAATSFAAPGIANGASASFGGRGVAVDTYAPLQTRQAAGNPVGGVSASGGDTYVFQISGADPKAIRAEIEALLRQKEREKRARAGSRLTD